MSKRSKHTATDKYHCILPVLKGEVSTLQAAKKNQVSVSTIQSWVYKYKRNGLEGLKESKISNRYSEALKYDAVQAVIFEKKSRLEVSKIFNISNASVLSKWISKYNEGRKLYATTEGKGVSTMTKARKTTLKERVEITQFTIANGQDYQLAVEKYKVSYQQVYSWVKKYQESGEAGLEDRRGHKKK